MKKLTYQQRVDIIEAAWPMTVLEIKAALRCGSTAAIKIRNQILARRGEGGDMPKSAFRQVLTPESITEAELETVKNNWPITVVGICELMKVGGDRARLVRSTAVRKFALETKWKQQQRVANREQRFAKLDAVFKEHGKPLGKNIMAKLASVSTEAVYEWRKARGIPNPQAPKAEKRERKRPLTLPVSIARFYNPPEPKPCKPQHYAPGRWFRSKRSGEIVPALFCVTGSEVKFFGVTT